MVASALLGLANRVGLAAVQNTWLGAAELGANGALPSPLPPRALDELQNGGFTVVPRWLPPKTCARLKEDASTLQASFAREARVGTRRDSNRLEIPTRRASTLALHPPPTLSGDVGTRLALTKMMRGLCSELNGGSLPPLAPSDTELGYVYYPVDGYYARHVDVPAAHGGWLDGGRVRREVSVLLYLDEGWEASMGGALRIHRDDETADGEPLPPIDVLPEAGTLVLLRSDAIAHEVLPTRRQRTGVVGWLRTTRRAAGGRSANR